MQTGFGRLRRARIVAAWLAGTALAGIQGAAAQGVTGLTVFGDSYADTGKDDNGDSNTNDRPAGIGRNTAKSPNFKSYNFNISKAVFLGSKGRNGSGMNMNVFANMSNAFNRTNYGTPSGVMTSSYFGKSFNARNPREIEAGVRFQF